MRIDLSKYLTERYLESISEQKFEGPVITISREFGCPAKKVAEKLASRLTEISSPIAKKMKWRWISKEIIDESARQLNMDPAEIQYVFRYEKRGVFDDILSSQSKKYYKSDRKIRNTIARVIRNIAREGNVIIVGRGGVAITREIEKSLHIHLEAPIGWRALRVSEKYCLTQEEAQKYARDIDNKRKAFRDYFHGKGSDYSRFDIVFNAMTLSVDEIVEGTIGMLKLRKMI
ncbi:MAG: cytidylate kinase-like family protein [Bacteroidales bacterium]|nr:cytidylate kinase-like family protein [Bacteroidales bacterium]